VLSRRSRLRRHLLQGIGRPTSRVLPLRDATWRSVHPVGPDLHNAGMSQTSAHRHHAIDYVELTVTNLEQAKRFYSEAFGWRFNDYGPEYAGIQSPQGGSAPEVGGLSTGREVRAGGPLVLLYSTDLDRSVEAVKDAGGQVVNGPYEFPGGRRFHFTDPSGNELGVWAEA
jgi:predicted enzyme related to lactoylglutathione lyase